jgi:hypothetical protein
LSSALPVEAQRTSFGKVTPSRQGIEGQNARMTDLDLGRIRPILGERRHGFEEFCAQLARHDPRVKGITGRCDWKVRAGNGGVECYWQLPSHATQTSRKSYRGSAYSTE